MKSAFSRAWHTVIRYRSCKPLLKLSRTVHALPSSDKFIVYILAGVIIIVSMVTIRSIEHNLFVSVPAYGGTIVEGDLGSPRYINPLLAPTDADRDITALTYAGLMEFSGKGEFVPVLAQSYTISPNGKTYTFILRKNARFSDGTPVTANDVVFTVKKAQNQNLKSPLFQDWHGVTATVINARTVKFTLPQPYAPFLQNTTLGILPEHLWKNISDAQFPFSRFMTYPVGAGPFVVSKVIRNATSGLITEYDLTASRDYVLGRPYLNGINIRFYPNNTARSQALLQGKITNAYGITTNNKNSRVLGAPSSSVFGVFFNENKDPVLTNLAIRKALSLAINRPQLIQDIFGGSGFPIMGPVPLGIGITQTPIPPSTHTIAQAAQTLTNSGWTYDGNAREWRNKAKKLVFNSLIIKTSNVFSMRAVATTVRNDWQKLGITVTVELYEPGDLNQNVIRPRDYQALLSGVAIDHGQDLFAFWHSSQRTDPGLNIALYANKTVDTLLEDARTVQNSKKRLADINAIEKDISADYPAAFIYNPKFIYTIPNGLRGVAIPIINTPSNRFATVSAWYNTTNLVWPFLASQRMP